MPEDNNGSLPQPGGVSGVSPTPPITPSGPAFMSQVVTSPTVGAPTPAVPSLDSSSPSSNNPVPVVKVLSVRGVEYLLMSLTLWMGAASLIWLLLTVVNKYNSLTLLIFPVSLLVVSVPAFSFFFLRLRKQEVANPELRMEPSKRRMTQTTQVLAYLTCFFNLVTFVYLVIGKLSGESSYSIVKALINLLVVLVVAGGILAYYWFDEHRMHKD